MKGFTLLEILVSIMILGIIMTAIYGAYTSNVEAIQIARQSGRLSQTARIILDRMSKDLESAFIGTDVPLIKPVVLGMIGEDQEIEDKPADRLDFTALTHLALTEGGLQTDLCEIGYYLEEDEEEEGEGLILYRRDHGIVDDDITTGGEAYELARIVMGLDIVFQDSLGEEFDDWDTLAKDNKDTLPSLIRIKLTLKDPLGRQQTFVTSLHPALANPVKEE